MNPTHTDFFGDLLNDLLDAGLDFIVCGGVASILHGVERTTLDLDISVSLKPDHVHKLISTMEHLGLVPRVPVNPNILGDPAEVEKIIREKHAVVFTFIHPKDVYIQLDVFLLHDLRYETLLPDAIDMPFRGKTLKVLSAEKLVALKRAIHPPRKKDELDIHTLENIIRERS